tara:strand:+ start:1609 stop:1779 length:171 start_codon:yes stop_codon:yes gene_type:complete
MVIDLDIHYEKYSLVLNELKNLFLEYEIDELFPYENDSSYDTDSSLEEINIWAYDN